jgi:hypothetical protein
VFPPELESDAFRADNGEYGWTREQIPQVVNILRSQGLAILGGELWWVREGSTAWDLIPQEGGRRAVYTWSGGRFPEESWPEFVERRAVEALTHAERWPAELGLPPNAKGRILCNLSWVSELEFDHAKRTKL